MQLESLTGFIRNTLTDTVKILTTRSGLKSLYGISLYRNAVYLMLNSAALALSSFLFWIAAARFYSTESVGIASAAISAAGVIVLLSNLGFDHGLIRFLPRAGNRAGEMINSSFTLTGLVSLVLAIIFLARLDIWSPALLILRGSPVFITVFILFTIVSILQGLAFQVFIAKRRAGFAMAQGQIFGLFRFIPLFLLTSFFQTFGILVSSGIAVFIAAVTAISLFLPRVESGYLPRPVINRQIIKDMVRYSIANYITSILWMLPHFVLPLMVLNMIGAEHNAYYFIGWSVASMLFSIPLAASFSLFTEGSYNEKKLLSEIKRSLKLILVLLVPAIIMLVIFGDTVLSFFGAAYFENGAKLLQILVFSTVPLSINYIYYGIKRVEMKMKSALLLSAFIAFTTLGLAYILLPQMGILGAGVAWLSSHTVAAIAVTYDLLRRH